jgi:hypothetical protein
MVVFWVVAPCSLVEVYQRFRGPCCLHNQGPDEDSHLRTHVRTSNPTQPSIWFSVLCFCCRVWSRSEVFLWEASGCPRWFTSGGLVGSEHRPLFQSLYLRPPDAQIWSKQERFLCVTYRLSAGAVFYCNSYYESWWSRDSFMYLRLNLY